MFNVTPDHFLAKEAYEKAKSLKTSYVHILGSSYGIKGKEQYYLSGVVGNNSEIGFNRLDWLTEYEELNGIQI
ncbi:hypothetical protein 2F1_3 [Uncultured Caudovirales phage clone 2F_1]|uniref:Uncharacterized protein n=1 Tax=Uncultured Caudovirales phage clone 2F_1 TaxID=2992576 RepID=A0A2H4J8L3_9CAUD|nr:hypothetical protein [Acinetobacter radioresistens]YP_010092431.1 hypothetical protein KNT73_gp03 [Uncultured Caudovirales phage clone 2F_1]ASN71604.1 hypothetical protein 2F1_3 [Uncultured Caudovirales phage clone 2F_1]RJL74401.1 hypothetical protein D5055_02690 [Acinetobacter radioresistens]